MASNQISTESGRIAIVPVQANFYTPMIEYCTIIPMPQHKMFVHVKTTNHPTKVKKHRIELVAIDNLVTDPAAKIFATSPVLVIGDATYIYVDRRASKEYERAVQACKNERKMAGSYRTNDGQIAAAVRLGNKECDLDIYCSANSVMIVPLLQ